MAAFENKNILVAGEEHITLTERTVKFMGVIPYMLRQW